MTVILMVAMFAIFLTIDYVRKGKEAKETATAGKKPHQLRRRYSPRS